MTYKAGDKVVWNDEICTFLAYNHNPQYVTLMNSEDDSFACKADSIRHATPVEIAKQAVLDELNDRSDSVSPILNELLDVLISKAEYNGALKIGATIIKDDNWSTTPSIIGDETKLD